MTADIDDQNRLNFGLLHDNFTCPVCLDILRDPVILPCAHSLCRSCAMQLIRGRILQCPLDRQCHRLSSTKFLQPNFDLKEIISKFLSRSFARNEFCKTCFFPVGKEDPKHSRCEKIDIGQGEILVQIREDAAMVIVKKTQPGQDDGHADLFSFEKNKNESMIRELQEEVNKAADTSTELINRQRLTLNKEIENKLSADLELLRKNPGNKEQMKTIQSYQVDRSEDLSTRISKLKNAEAAIEEFQLPNLKPLQKMVSVFKSNVLAVESEAFYESPCKRIKRVNGDFGDYHYDGTGGGVSKSAESTDGASVTLPSKEVFHSKVGFSKTATASHAVKFFLHPVPADILVAKQEFRAMAAHDVQLSGFNCPNVVWVSWRTGGAWSGDQPDLPWQDDSLRVGDRQVALLYAGGMGNSVPRLIRGDFLLCTVASQDARDLQLSGGLHARVELEKLASAFNLREI